MRFRIIRNARIENVGKYQACVVSKLRIIYMETDRSTEEHEGGAEEETQQHMPFARAAGFTDHQTPTGELNIEGLRMLLLELLGKLVP